MTSGLRELYGDAILDHCKQPRNCRALEDADRRSDAWNPVCGDRVTLYLRREGEVLTEICFQATACALVRASASMLTAALTGRRLDEARRLASAFRAFLDEARGSQAQVPELGGLQVFAAVRAFPARVTCALLAWDALDLALGHSTPATISASLWEP